MSVGRIATFVIGLILGIFGLIIILQTPFDWIHDIIGLIFILVGVWLLMGLPISL